MQCMTVQADLSANQGPDRDIRLQPSLQELEDMLLRYERQLKSEIQARQAAETAAAEALAAMSHGPGGQHGNPDWQNQQEQLQQVGADQLSRQLVAAGSSSNPHRADADDVQCPCFTCNRKASVAFDK